MSSSPFSGTDSPSSVIKNDEQDSYNNNNKQFLSSPPGQFEDSHSNKMLSEELAIAAGGINRSNPSNATSTHQLGIGGERSDLVADHDKNSGSSNNNSGSLDDLHNKNLLPQGGASHNNDEDSTSNLITSAAVPFITNNNNNVVTTQQQQQQNAIKISLPNSAEQQNLDSIQLQYLQLHQLQQQQQLMNNNHGGQQDGGQNGSLALAGGALDPSLFQPLSNLYVSNLSMAVDNDLLFSWFRAYGPLVSACVMVDVHTGRSRGYGFVQYENEEHGEVALKELHGRVMFVPRDNTTIILRVQRSMHHKGIPSAPSSTVFVRNIPCTYDSAQLLPIMNQYGPVDRIQLYSIFENPKLLKACIDFKTQAGALAAVNALHRKLLDPTCTVALAARFADVNKKQGSGEPVGGTARANANGSITVNHPSHHPSNIINHHNSNSQHYQQQTAMSQMLAGAVLGKTAGNYNNNNNQQQKQMFMPPPPPPPTQQNTNNMNNTMMMPHQHQYQLPRNNTNNNQQQQFFNSPNLNTSNNNFVENGSRRNSGTPYSNNSQRNSYSAGGSSFENNNNGVFTMPSDIARRTSSSVGSLSNSNQQQQSPLANPYQNFNNNSNNITSVHHQHQQQPQSYNHSPPVQQLGAPVPQQSTVAAAPPVMMMNNNNNPMVTITFNGRQVQAQSVNLPASSLPGQSSASPSSLQQFYMIPQGNGQPALLVPAASVQQVQQQWK